MYYLSSIKYNTKYSKFQEMATKKNPLLNDNGTPKRNTDLSNTIDSLFAMGAGKNRTDIGSMAIYLSRQTDTKVSSLEIQEYVQAF